MTLAAWQIGPFGFNNRIFRKQVKPTSEMLKDLLFLFNDRTMFAPPAQKASFSSSSLYYKQSLPMPLLPFFYIFSLYLLVPLGVTFVFLLYLFMNMIKLCITYHSKKKRSQAHEDNGNIAHLPTVI